jgi:hypothetical protein
VHIVLSKQKNFSTDFRQSESSDGFFFNQPNFKNLQFDEFLLKLAQQMRPEGPAFGSAP